MSEGADERVEAGDEVPLVDLSGTSIDLGSEAVTHVDRSVWVPTETEVTIPPTPEEHLIALRSLLEQTAAAVARLEERTEAIGGRVESLYIRTTSWDGVPLNMHIRNIEKMLAEHTEPGLFG